MIKPLVLIDGSSYFFRAFHALPPLTNSKGLPTGAIYGVANMIKRFIKEHQPTHLAVVFDAEGKTFRDTLFPAYKAHRPPTPPDLRVQFKPLIALLEAMGLPVLVIPDVEADDVIATLAQRAYAQQWPVLISTGDKDMAQLVNEHITLINTMANQRLDVQGVIEKFGVRPDQIIDYLALIGDTSDNVPGVAKCGPKTASKWLATYDNIACLKEHAAEIGGKIGESLRASLEQLALSQTLVTLKTDVELNLSLEDLVIKSNHLEHMITLARELEFNAWLKELLNTAAPSETPPPVITSTMPITHLTDVSALKTWLPTLNQATMLCLDLETNNPDPMRAALLGIAMMVDAKHVFYVPITRHDDPCLELLKPVLENTAVIKLGHDLKNSHTVLKNHGVTLNGVLWDTMMVSYLLNSTRHRHDLPSLSTQFLDTPPTSKATPSQDAIARVNQVFHLYPLLASRLTNTLQHVLDDIELPLIPVLADLERHGVLIDEPLLVKHSARLKIQLHALEEEAYTLAGKAFNLNSPKQLQVIFYEELGYPVIEKTPTGQPSTAESVLQTLAEQHRLPAIILSHRSLSKLVSTYLDALPKCINPETGRVHTSYNQAVTSTGRLSSSDPNLQNIPIRTEEGRLIRRAFIAPPEHALLAADYSQIELRIMAHLSQDTRLLYAFAHELDIHVATASEMFAIPLQDVTHEQRRRAKAVNFGLIYGMSAFGLAKQLGVGRNEAEHYIARYFERYPGVHAYMERTRAQAHEQGYVETVFGRRLDLPEINARNLMRQKAAERTAINAPMQGTAADIIKKAMLNISTWQQQHPEHDVSMIMQVHDELVFEVHHDVIELAKTVIREKMEQAVVLSVPLCVSIGVGSNWDEAHA